MRKEPISDTRYLRKDGTITTLFLDRLEEVLDVYVNIVKFWANKRQKDPADYALRETFIVGSLLNGVDDSDLDLMFIGNKIDDEDYRFIKLVMARVFYSDHDKSEAIDVYIRPYDAFPERGSFGITDQIQGGLNRHNSRINRLKRD